MPTTTWNSFAKLHYPTAIGATFGEKIRHLSRQYKETGTAVETWRDRIAETASFERQAAFYRHLRAETAESKPMGNIRAKRACLRARLARAGVR